MPLRPSARLAVSQPVPGRARLTTGSVGISAQLRTPEAPGLLAAGGLAVAVGLDWSSKPEARILLGLGRSSKVRAGLGQVQFTLAFARLEVSAGVLRFGRLRLRGALAAETGRLEGRVTPDDGEFAAAEGAAAAWIALLELVRLEYEPAERFFIECDVGAIEPLRRHYFYVDRPYERGHGISGFGDLAGLGISYRFH